MKQHSLLLGALAICCLSVTGNTLARKKPAAPAETAPAAATAPALTPQNSSAPGVAEARLIEVYQLIAKTQGKEALLKAERLVRDFPNFQLAQLVYGDLLSARTRPLKTLGDVPKDQIKGAELVLDQLRTESQLRLKALRERPQEGAVPSEFFSLSRQNKHAIAIDASRSRLYLFENRASGLVLINDFYISLGKSGLEKVVEGDLRTPLGVYFITSNLDPKSLKDIYGSGALPLNYPNILDSKRGKTGKGIWLHGTPPAQFARAPLATDGCVVLANPDLLKVIKTVEVRTTPVVISKRLNWVMPSTILVAKKPFEEALNGWKLAKSSGKIDSVLSYYSADFNSNGITLAQWTPVLSSELARGRGRPIELKDVSMLHWSDSAETMVVTFGEVTGGRRTGATKRQYWARQGNQWKIFFEGIV